MIHLRRLNELLPVKDDSHGVSSGLEVKSSAMFSELQRLSHLMFSYGRFAPTGLNWAKSRLLGDWSGAGRGGRMNWTSKHLAIGTFHGHRSSPMIYESVHQLYIMYIYIYVCVCELV